MYLFDSNLELWKHDKKVMHFSNFFKAGNSFSLHLCRGLKFRNIYSSTFKKTSVKVGSDTSEYLGTGVRNLTGPCDSWTWSQSAGVPTGRRSASTPSGRHRQDRMSARGERWNYYAYRLFRNGFSISCNTWNCQPTMRPWTAAQPLLKVMVSFTADHGTFYFIF